MSILGSAMIDDFSQPKARSRRLTSSRYLTALLADLFILILESLNLIPTLFNFYRKINVKNLFLM